MPVRSKRMAVTEAVSRQALASHHQY
jgi:hypothetical protein